MITESGSRLILKREGRDANQVDMDDRILQSLGFSETANLPGIKLNTSGGRPQYITSFQVDGDKVNYTIEARSTRNTILWYQSFQEAMTGLERERFMQALLNRPHVKLNNPQELTRSKQKALESAAMWMIVLGARGIPASVVPLLELVGSECQSEQDICELLEKLAGLSKKF